MHGQKTWGDLFMILLLSLSTSSVQQAENLHTVEPPTVGGLLTSCILHDPIKMKLI